MATQVSSSNRENQVRFPQTKQASTCSTAKVCWIALGVLLMIAGAVATGLLYPQVGNYAFIALAVGTITGIIALAVGCRMKVNPPSDGVTLAERRHKACTNNQRTGLVHYSFIEADPKRSEVKQQVAKFLNDPHTVLMSPQEQRAMGIMLGMACGDAVGAPYEFLNFKAEGYTPDVTCNRFSLKPGQWTDDTSMGLCLADALIENKGLDEQQLMWAFSDWWSHGYNNAFTVGEPSGSVGLGGNISASFNGFKSERNKTGSFATKAGDQNTSGNGSLMRLGPVAIAARSEAEALELAWKQSKVTHQGDEAAGSCQLMAFLLFHALHAKEEDPQARKQALFKKLETFTCSVPSVCGLALSASSVTNPATKEMENWNWKEPNFSFNPSRLSKQPGYIGSYSLDGLAMALHCIYTTHSFQEAVIKAGTRGGDADTVGAIAGQIAGAIYGVQGIPQEWRDAVHQWDRGGEIATRAYLLCE